MLIFTRLLPRRVALALIFSLITVVSAVAQTAQECTARVTLLQVNDVYNFLPVDRGESGGLARVSAVRKKIIKESPNTLFLLAGDTISPSVESSQMDDKLRGKQMIDAWNAVELDYAVLGNHEFDFGPDLLRQRMKESNFKWLASNVIDKTTGKLFADVPPFVMYEFKGIKVGLFGLVLPETKSTSKAGSDVEFLNPCETAMELVPVMRARGAQVIVALTHLSLREDKQVARCAPIDVIIGGHEHTLHESLSERTPIFKMTADAREVGRIDLNISTITGKLESIDWEVIPVTKEIETNEEYDFASAEREFATVTAVYKDLLDSLAIKVGRTETDLDARSRENRTGETNVGNFVADSFRAAMGADVALINGGSIRADTIIPEGELTNREVLSILPFKNRVVKIKVTGKTLLAALENGVSRSAEESEPGRFPQVSGLRFSFDATRPAGKRIDVKDVTINGQPLVMEKTYTLATATFLANGGDDYKMFANNSSQPGEAVEGEIDSEILIKAIKSSKGVIAPRTDGRIKRLDKSANQGRKNCHY